MCVCVHACVRVCMRVCVCVRMCTVLLYVRMCVRFCSTWKVIKKGFPPTSSLIDVASRMVTLRSKLNFTSDLGMELANKSGRASLHGGQAVGSTVKTVITSNQ